MPPMPIASPSVTPDAIPSRLGRYSCPITTETLKDITVTKPIAASSTPATSSLGARMKPSSSGIWATIEPTSTLRRPIRSTSCPPTSVPSAPATSIAARNAFAVASLAPYSWMNQIGAKDCSPK